MTARTSLARTGRTNTKDQLVVLKGLEIPPLTVGARPDGTVPVFDRDRTRLIVLGGVERRVDQFAHFGGRDGLARTVHAPLSLKDPPCFLDPVGVTSIRPRRAWRGP